MLNTVEPAAVAESTDDPVRVAVIVGSIRDERFCPVPARWIADEARRREDFDVDLVDLADFSCPTVLNGNNPDAGRPAEVDELGERIAAAEAFVVVTPVYNRSFPASLKAAIDWFHTEWIAKPVGFVSYGGDTGGLLAVEHLRGVFTEFHSVTLRDTIMFPNFWDAFDHDGRLVDSARGAARATAFLDQLHWWAAALRQARARRAFPVGEAE